MFEGNDKELYNYTMKIMESITSSYTDGGMRKDAKKLIEKAVATRIAAIMPNKYTEAEITVAKVCENLYVTATYSIDGDAKIVAIHKEIITEDVPSMMKAPAKLGVSPRGAGSDYKEKVAAFMDKRKAETKDYPQYDKNGYYDPRCTREDFIFPRSVAGRGSKVETLPGKRLWEGLKIPNAPTSCAPMTKKTPVGSEKPTIDFKSISQLSPPSSDGLPRYDAGVHVGIDLAKVDVHQEAVDNMANEIRKEIDKDIINDLMAVSTALHTPPEEALTLEKLESVMGKIDAWLVPTSGWSKEYTTWDSPFSGGLTDNYEASWYKTNRSQELAWSNPYRTAMEEISFTEEELDELIDLIGTVQSEVMKFE